MNPDEIAIWFAIPAAIILWGTLAALKMKDFLTD